MQLPKLPEEFHTVYVDFPPNPYFNISKHDRELCYNAVREDKGKKVLEGILKAKDSKYFMVVDDDDLLHKDLVSYIEEHDNDQGWFIESGYIWYENMPFLIKRVKFNHLCGTSNIIFRQALEIEQNQQDLEFVKQYLGSHVFVQEKMQELGKPLEPLPFKGAVYRMGHADAHSRALQPNYSFIKLLLRYKLRVNWLTKDLKSQYAMNNEV